MNICVAVDTIPTDTEHRAGVLATVEPLIFTSKSIISHKHKPGEWRWYSACDFGRKQVPQHRGLSMVMVMRAIRVTKIMAVIMP